MKIKIITCICMVFSNMLQAMESNEKKVQAHSNPVQQTDKSFQEILYFIHEDKIDVGDIAVKKMVKKAFIAESKKLDEAFERTGLAKQFWSYSQDDTEQFKLTQGNSLRQRRVTNADHDQL
jgi:hypothetical protein